MWQNGITKAVARLKNCLDTNLAAVNSIEIMKPTPEQIEAALRYADKVAEVLPHTSLATLAAAYREQHREIAGLNAIITAAINTANVNHFSAMEACQQRDTLKSKPCAFCNESPQTENEKDYCEEFKNMMGELPMMGEWLAGKQNTCHNAQNMQKTSRNK